MNFRSTFLQELQASFLLILLLSFVLPEPYKFIKCCLWSCTHEQILAYSIDIFLIPCYHQNSKGNLLLNIIRFNNLPHSKGNVCKTYFVPTLLSEELNS